MGERPLVSIITASLNNMEGLKQTAASVASQTFRDFEHIVIDGGSTDGTVEWLAASEYPIKWLSEPDRGIGDAMNKGIQQASGFWILVLQASDVLVDETGLEIATSELDETVDLVCFDVDFLTGGGSRRLRSRGYSFRLNFKPFPHQGAFTKATLFDRVGRFDCELRVHMDYDFYLRSYRSGALSKSTGIVLSSMPDGGISSRLDWPSLRQRFAEERRIQLRHCPNTWWRMVYSVYWPPYFTYRRLRSALAPVGNNVR